MHKKKSKKLLYRSIVGWFNRSYPFVYVGSLDPFLKKPNSSSWVIRIIPWRIRTSARPNLILYYPGWHTDWGANCLSHKARSSYLLAGRFGAQQKITIYAPVIIRISSTIQSTRYVCPYIKLMGSMQYKAYYVAQEQASFGPRGSSPWGKHAQPKHRASRFHYIILTIRHFMPSGF